MKTKRLAFEREIVAVLTSDELDQVFGGKGLGPVSSVRPPQHGPVSSARPPQHGGGKVSSVKPGPIAHPTSSVQQHPVIRPTSSVMRPVGGKH